MFGKWFSRKEREDAKSKPTSRLFEYKITEPQRRAKQRPTGRPPADADRDFVYYDR